MHSFCLLTSMELSLSLMLRTALKVIPEIKGVIVLYKCKVIKKPQIKSLCNRLSTVPITTQNDNAKQTT